MKKELEKTYNPADIEDRLYAKWVNKKYFHAEVNANKKPYTIVIPPPNITGQLHMGHALDNTLQDIIIRSKRMQGYETLWMPGTDHASIATEAKIVEAMKEEGLTKDDIGREKFLERAWAWKDKFGGRIVSQLKKMGSSCDWDRERFTMDEGCNKAVKEVFVNLYNKGLIYRGERIINWCPHCLTSISDAEVEYEDQKGHFWHLRYAFADGSGYINLATTRPETLLGDTAVAVNPNDERYKDLVGKKLILPLVHREIPLIADDYVDMEFGTGVVKITPAHDPNDFEVGLRHDLPIINVMTDDAKIVDEYEKYAGMDRYEARKAIVEDLEKEGALVKIEDHDHNVGTCYRCGTTVEPRVSKQWFVKMKPLAGPAIDAVKEGKTKFVPEHFNKTYFHWLENIRDWCISRQLWWGHRIPAYYCGDCGEIIVAEEAPEKCPKCGSTHLHQDEDVLDTWFSSALWPFSTLGWPDETEDLDYFYPTSVLVTGYDIIFFWVVRMVFSGLEAMGEVPFKHVYIHGLVRDAEGRKMSKSLGNGIDPLQVIENYGADALRFMLINGITPGNDMRFVTEKLDSSRNFANKLWNASRFVIMNLTGDDEEFLPMADISGGIEKLALADEDKWILSTVNAAAAEITANMEKFELSLAAQKAYDLIWNNYCDWHIEFVKSRLYGDDEEDKKVARTVLVKVLKDLLKLLHPVMPFITEEIWSCLPVFDGEVTEENPRGYLMKQSWPVYDDALSFPEEEEIIGRAMEAVRTVRNIRAEVEAAPSKKVRAIIAAAGKAQDDLKKAERHIMTQANVSEIAYVADKSEITEEVMSGVITDAEILIAMDELMDYKAEFERLTKEKKKLEGEVARVSGKLSNENFVNKAPEKVINAEREKLVKYEDMLKTVIERLAIVEKKL